VVLSQWKVDDAATTLLMVRFYRNLLGKREGLASPLPPGRALAEAQGWLRNLTFEQARARLDSLAPLWDRRGRGTIADAPRRGRKANLRPFAHPHYWSAFVLIGDPGDVSTPPETNAPPPDGPGPWGAAAWLGGGVAGSLALVWLLRRHS
jgi:CHAT domain-containing protein